MKYSFRIGAIWGIPIELHITFILLMAGIFIIAFPDFYSFSLVLFLFIFVLTHELTHSLVAKHYNIRVRKIVLYPIGGVSEIEEIPDNPRVEWRMAIAGPLSSFAVGALLLAVDRIITIEGPAVPGFLVARNLLYSLGILNLVLGAFNLVPAFPMDGGRVFRALLAEHTSFSDATKYAAFIGKILGIAMVVLGFIYNYWLIVVGFFVYIGATEEAESTIVSTTMARVRVGDVMYPEIGAVAPEATMTDAIEAMFRSRYHDILVEKDGVLRGVIAWTDIVKVDPTRRSQQSVGELPMKMVRVFADESVLEAYKTMNREKVDLVPVVDRGETQKVVGVITNESISYALEKAKALR